MAIQELRVKLHPDQKEMLRNLTRLSGAKNESDYARQRLFEDPSIHEKLNRIEDNQKIIMKTLEAVFLTTSRGRHSPATSD